MSIPPITLIEKEGLGKSRLTLAKDEIRVKLTTADYPRFKEIAYSLAEKIAKRHYPITVTLRGVLDFEHGRIKLHCDRFNPERIFKYRFDQL